MNPLFIVGLVSLSLTLRVAEGVDGHGILPDMNVGYRRYTETYYDAPLDNTHYLQIPADTNPNEWTPEGFDKCIQHCLQIGQSCKAVNYCRQAPCDGPQGNRKWCVPLRSGMQWGLVVTGTAKKNFPNFDHYHVFRQEDAAGHYEKQPPEVTDDDMWKFVARHA